MDDILFSVITSAYNADSFIRRAINSVLQQDYKNFEYIIVDNGSNDSTFDILQEYQSKFPNLFKIFHIEKNVGISGGRNFGIQNAIGSYICFLDADDYWTANKLSQTSKAIQNHKNFNIFCHWEYHEYECDNKKTRKIVKYRSLPESRQYEDLLLNGNCLSTSAMTIERVLLEKTGGFDVKLISGEEDIDLWLRLLRNSGNVFMITQPLGYWVIRNDSVSSKLIEHSIAVIRVKEKYCFELVSDFPRDKSLKKKCTVAIAKSYCSLGRGLSKRGIRKDANNFYYKSLSIYPFYLKSYVGIILNLLHL